LGLAARIKEARQTRLFLTQRELADKLDVEPVSVSRWERGVAEPRIRTIRELAALAETPVEWFFTENGAGL
jgi:transcriptional regulator with XRE-family HTH domain